MALIASANAIVPDAQIHQDIMDSKQPPRLPNLAKVNSIADLSPEWFIKGAMALDEGRLVLQEGSASVWSRQPLTNSNKDWTIEVIFRNSERVEVDDHLYFDSNGFSFWLLESELPSDTANFGGPRTYDGIHILINNKEGRGLKIFANDGTGTPTNSKTDSLGWCDLNYLDSSIPFTLRLSYSATDKIFKVQIDNNLCFKTEKLSFDNLKEDFLIGVSASTDPKSQEFWELFKLDTFLELTEDAIDDHGIIEEGLVKMVTLTQFQESTPTETPAKRQSLMEKAITGSSQTGLAKLDKNIEEINKKLQILETALGAIDHSKLSDLSTALKEVNDVQKKQLVVLEDLKRTHEDFQALLQSNFKEMVNSIGVLHQKVIDEIRQHQVETHLIESKVDILMSNHKEILKQYQEYAGEMERKSDSSEFFNVVVRWVLLPFIVLFAGLSLLIYRLRKDIKHSKII